MRMLRGPLCMMAWMCLGSAGCTVASDRASFVDGQGVPVDVLTVWQADEGTLRARLDGLPTRMKAWGLFRLGRDEAFDASPYLDDPAPEVRYRAAECLGRQAMGVQEPIRSLLQAKLYDVNTVVRIAAAWALARAAVHLIAVGHLVEALGREHRPSVSRDAHRRLRQLFGDVVPYDADGSYKRRDAARDAWASALSQRAGLLGLPVRREPPTPEAVRDRARLRTALDRIAGAHLSRSKIRELWTQAMEASGGDAEVLELRRELFSRLGPRLDSEGLFHRDYALTLFHVGRETDALRHYGLARRLHPGQPSLLNAHGVALKALGDSEAAARAFDAALALDAASSDALWNRALLCAREHRWEEALQALDGDERLDPARWEDHSLLRGVVLEAIRKPTESVMEVP